jgi:hypothetical protein
MGLKGFALAVVVVIVALAATAGNALATATTTKAEWYTGAKEGSVTTLTGKQPLTVSAPGKVELMFPIAGLPIRMRASAVSCVECVMTNESSGQPGAATATGKLLFSGVIFTEPPTCKFKEGKITTEPLRFEADYMEGERWLLKIVPVSGEVALTLNIEKIEAGKICPFEGSGTPVKNVNFGEFKAKTGSFALEQPVNFSLPISEEAGSNWTFGPQPFSLTGELDFKAGGSYFGVK